VNAPSGRPRERENEPQGLRFLAEAGRILGSSLNFEETLRDVAQLAVPELADWCIVDVLDGTQLRRLTAAHADPEKESLALDLARRFPPDLNSTSILGEALRTGRAQVMTRITSAHLHAVARDAEHLEMLEELGLRSALVAPMIARQRIIGAITLIMSESAREYHANDIGFVCEIAGRAALAVDNARLFREAERRAREEGALRRAAAALSASFTIDEVIQQIAENALQACEADASVVGRIELDKNQVVFLNGAGTQVVRPGLRSPYQGSYTQRVVERGEAERLTRLVEAADAGCPVLPGMAQQFEDWSGVIVPLLNSGEAIGALVLLRRPGSEEAFRDDEVERAISFGKLAALAFRKVHLLEESEKAREELQRVMESRARLMRGFTHDLKNPLGAADGHAQLLEDGLFEPLGPKAKESVTRIRKSIRDALVLINDLVDLARAEAGMLEVECEPVQVREAVNDMVEEYRASAERKGLTVQLRTDPDLPIIESDSRRIRQILGNLLSNAVKYTDRGGISVCIALRNGRETPGPGTWIGIEVADSGPGIEEAKAKLLFQEFVRLGVDTKPGAGLGLAISDRIAQALSGRITLKSEVGRGSVFALWLPCAGSQRRAA
jgi:signal transduction histidine kinase